MSFFHRLDWLVRPWKGQKVAAYSHTIPLVGYASIMSNPFDESIEPALDPSETPAPGGPNDPGASAADENQADTPGYSGGGDADPTEGPQPDDDARLDDLEDVINEEPV